MRKKQLAWLIALTVAVSGIPLTAQAADTGSAKVLRTPEQAASVLAKDGATLKSKGKSAKRTQQNAIESRVIVDSKTMPADTYGAEKAYYYQPGNFYILKYDSVSAAEDAVEELQKQYPNGTVYQDVPITLEDTTEETSTVDADTTEDEAEEASAVEENTEEEATKNESSATEAEASATAEDSEEQETTGTPEEQETTGTPGDQDDGPNPYNGMKLMGLDDLKEDAASWSGDVTVAVIDSGIDVDHPWFTDRLDRENSVNLSTVDYPEASAYDDKSGHGTHVAGIVTQGTSDQVEIMAIRVFNILEQSSLTTITLGVDYATQHGADVLNMSLGSAYSSVNDMTVMDKAFARAMEKDITVCVASGNEYRDVSTSYPASSGWTISIGSLQASKSQDGLYRSDFSNYGTLLDFVAPGRYITSAWPGETPGEESTATISGTSMATPHMAAAAAMVKLKHPEYNQWDVYATFQDYAVDLGEPGKDTDFGYGYVDFTDYVKDDTKAGKRHQAIVTDSAISRSMNETGKPLELTATLSKGDGALSYRTTDANIATVEGNKLLVHNAGSCEIVVTAGETEKYIESERRIQLTVTKGQQTITVPKDTYTRSISDGAFQLAASVDAPGDGKLTFLANSDAGEIIDLAKDGTVTPKKEGTIQVYAIASGTKNFERYVSDAITVNITKAAAKPVSLKKVTISKVKAYKKKAKVSWKKQSSVTGYQVRYSYKSSMKSAKTVKISGASKTSKTITKLKSKKKCYFQVRSYKNVSGKTYYGSWSKTVKAKIK